MRLDVFLKTVGILRSRSQVKRCELRVNKKVEKPSYEVKLGDEIEVVDKDGDVLKVRVMDVPKGQIPKKERDKYIKILGRERLYEEKDSFLKWLFENH